LAQVHKSEAPAGPVSASRFFQPGEDDGYIGVRRVGDPVGSRRQQVTEGVPGAPAHEKLRLMCADETAPSSVPPLGSGRASLFAALAAVGGSVLLMRWGCGHTEASQRFADLPEFDVWIWVLAAEVAAAAAAGVAMWPAFHRLAEATGRPAVFRAVAAFLAVGLLVMFGPRALPSGGESPLWLHFERVALFTIVGGILVSPSFLGLMLVQARLSALDRKMPIAVEEGRAGRVVIELAWLRVAMQRFLVSFALVISGAVLTAGALRGALIANGSPAGDLPVSRILTYGGSFTLLSSLAFVPAYVAWQERVRHLRDRLLPIPRNGLPPPDWHQARSDFDALLSAQASAGSIIAAAFSILAPLAGGLVAALIPTS
jgi:hypothetical protein